MEGKKCKIRKRAKGQETEKRRRPEGKKRKIRKRKKGKTGEKSRGGEQRENGEQARQ